MKKTINITLAGRLFLIEEDAFIILKNYLEQLELYFNKSEESQEIIQDIEARMADLFHEFLNAQKGFIIREEVEEVIKRLGKPKDIAEGEDVSIEEEWSGSQESEEKTTRKLYRNPDDQIIGGVCSGLAAYFDVEVVWVRLLFLLLLFVFGNGILLYIILLVLMPEANTTADKLRMKGKPITIHSIQEAFKEEVKTISQELENLVNDSENKSKLKRALDTLFKSLKRLFQSLFQALSSVLNFVFKSLKWILLIVSILGIASIFLAFAVFNGFWHSDLVLVSQVIFGADTSFNMLVINLFGLILLPLVFIFLLALKGIVAKNLAHTLLLFAVPVLWFVFVFYAVFFGLRFASEFKVSTQISKVETLGRMKTLYINSIEPKWEGTKRDDWGYIVMDNLVVDEDSVHLCQTHFVRFKPSLDSNAYVEYTIEARGANEKEALNNAHAYHYKSQLQGATLNLKTWMSFTGNQVFRHHIRSVTISVPAYMQVVVNKKAKKLLSFKDIPSDLDDQIEILDN